MWEVKWKYEEEVIRLSYFWLTGHSLVWLHAIRFDTQGRVHMLDNNEKRYSISWGEKKKKIFILKILFWFIFFFIEGYHTKVQWSLEIRGNCKPSFDIFGGFFLLWFKQRIFEHHRWSTTCRQTIWHYSLAYMYRLYFPKKLLKIYCRLLRGCDRPDGYLYVSIKLHPRGQDKHTHFIYI